MIRKEIIKIVKLSFLIGVRQLWFLVVNIYHLVREPYLTIKNLFEEKDKSQGALLLGTAVLPAVGYVGLRFLWDYFWYGAMLPGFGSIFWGVVLIESIIWGYILYWIYRVKKSNGNT